LLVAVAHSSQLSPGAAIGVGVACGAMGAFVILVGLGVVGDLNRTAPPPWILVVAGLVFVFGGSFGSGPVSDASGRIALGVGVILMRALTALLAVVSFKRVRRAHRP
jgi:hypothetical protein